MHGSDPPACTAHAPRGVDPKVPPGQGEGLRRRVGAPPGNQNARTHGFYARTLSPQEMGDLVSYAASMSLDDEVACARVALRRVLEFVRQDSSDLNQDQYIQVVKLVFYGTRTIARLLRERTTLSDAAADRLTRIFGKVLDDLGTEWGREL
jgi:hypothetical protein